MTPASNALARRIGVAPGPIHNADAIVVLGSGVMRAGVLDDESMRRAKRVFDTAGLTVQPAISTDWISVAASPKDRLWLTMRLMQESAALVYYRVAGYIGPE